MMIYAGIVVGVIIIVLLAAVLRYRGKWLNAEAKTEIEAWMTFSHADNNTDIQIASREKLTNNPATFMSDNDADIEPIQNLFNWDGEGLLNSEDTSLNAATHKSLRKYQLSIKSQVPPPPQSSPLPQSPRSPSPPLVDF
jgi:hypothetical protein